jgi:hypothetical protein
LNREAAGIAAGCADESVLLAADPAEHGVVDPVLLNELELPFDVAIQADEEHSPFVAVCRRRAWRKRLAVGAASPQHPVPIGRVQRRRGIGCQRVTRVGPPDVRADWAGEAMRIVCERELVAAGAGGVGRGERHAVGTTPDQPRGEFLRVLRRRRGAGDGRDEISEFRDVLFQLSKDQVRAVAAKLTKVGSPAGTYCRQQGVAVEPRVDRNSWIERSIAGRVAQKELARLDQMLRAPLGDPIDRAVRAFDFRLRDPVSEPEMLAVKRPACGGLLLGIGHELADQIGVEA